MFNGPFAQYNPFFQPSFANYQGGFNPQFNPQFGSQFGIPYGYFPAATSFGAPAGWNAAWNTSPWTGNFGSPFAGQFPGTFQAQSGQFPWTGQNGSFVGGNATSGGAWNPVVTQTSDAFNGGPTSGPTSATFTPYSYNQPFFPGYSGQSTPTAFGNGFAPQASPLFGSQLGGQFGGTLGTQFGTPFGTPFGPQAAFGGFNTQPAFSSTPAFFNPGWYGSAPTNSFPTFGPSVFNGYTTFPSFVGAAGFGSTPGFSGWNQASAGTPAWGWTNSFPVQFPGQFANQFQGHFPPQFAAQFGNFGGTPFGGTTGGATNQGWFPGQATFPWYTPVNTAFNGQNTTQPGNSYGPQFGGQYGSQFGGIAGGPSIPGGPTNTATRPTDATEGTQPRGIQFNRDAA